MRQRVLLDTGPLVALLDRRESFHSWSVEAFRAVQYPLITCEPVITEACFLLSNMYAAQEAVMSLIDDDAIRVDFSLGDRAGALSKLISQYDSVPMSLADACLVKLAELNRSSVVMTFDSDFRVYRMNRNKVIPLMMPNGL